MIKEIILAIIQAATEFLPISSDGHLALVSNILGTPNLAFITFLHLASLMAVIIFTKKEIVEIFKFKKESLKLILLIFIGIAPAAIVGYLFSNLIEETLSSYILIGVFFIFTGIVVFSTKYAKQQNKEVDKKSAFAIGLMQVIALLPGVSRSGMTISSSMFLGIDKEKAVKFSFLMLIPLIIGAFSLEFIKHPDTISSIPFLTLLFSFFVCFILSLFFLRMLNYIVKTEKFWIFGIYCFFIGVVSFMMAIL